MANFGISQSSSTRLGLTSSVVGPGTIRLTAPGADTSVLATLSRDPAGRQVVTVNTSDGFSINLSTQDLANLATNASTFLDAITAAVPTDVEGAGPETTTVYRRVIATGGTPEIATEVATSEPVQTAVQTAQITAMYNGNPPPEALDVAGTGATAVQPDGQPAVMAIPSSLIPDTNGYDPTDGLGTAPVDVTDGSAIVPVVNAGGTPTQVNVTVCGIEADACSGASIPLIYQQGDPPAGMTLVFDPVTGAASAEAAEAAAAAIARAMATQAARTVLVDTGVVVAAECATGVGCLAALPTIGFGLLGAGATYLYFNPDAWNTATTWWNGTGTQPTASTDPTTVPTPPGPNGDETRPVEAGDPRNGGSIDGIEYRTGEVPGFTVDGGDGRFYRSQADADVAQDAALETAMSVAGRPTAIDLAAGGVPIVLNPADLRWSQRTAGGNGRADAFREILAESGYVFPPIDVVQTSDGIVTVDHTRAAVALEYGIESIPATLHNRTDPLPESMAGRFGSATTWGEAAAYRAAMQRPPLPATGTPVPPTLPPIRN